jgi:hypothetical protein
MLNPPVVVDGRVDREKLRELLLIGAEQEALDFKATIDFAEPGDQIELTKDLLAMMSLPEGGYVIVGVDNSGNLATDQAPINTALFDSATLHQKLMNYVDGRITIVSQVHEFVLENDDARSTWSVALIFAGPPPGLFPLVVKKHGEYERSGGRKNQVVFRAGQIIVRDGTTTASLRSEFWPRLLERYTESIRDDTRRGMDALVNRIVATLDNQQDSPTTSVEDGMKRGRARHPTPVDVDMDLATFAIAADALIESDSLPRLNRLLIQASGRLRQGGASDRFITTQGVLDRVFVLANSAVLYGSTKQLDRVIETLVDYYNAVPEIPNATPKGTPQEQQRATAWFEVLSRLYLLGSLAVRNKKWTALRSLVLRPYKVHDTYTYASWLRHAVTSAARADVLQPEDSPRGGAPVISRAVQLATEIPELRPDVLGTEDLQRRLLDSLCEFDILWCILAQSVTTRPRATDFYPSSAELDQVHTNKAFTLIAEDGAARRLLFPEKSDKEIGSALLYVYSMAHRQAMNHRGRWDSLPDLVLQWTLEVRADEPDLR